MSSEEYDIWTSVPFSFERAAEADFGGPVNNSMPTSYASNDSLYSSSSSWAPSMYDEHSPLRQPITPPKQALLSPTVEECSLADLIKTLKTTSMGKQTLPYSTSPFKLPASAGARYVRVSGLPSSLLPSELATFFKNKSGFGAVKAVLTDQLATYSFIVIAFHDVRDAASAAEQLRYERGFGCAIETECITRDQLMKTTSSCYKILSESEGEVQIDVVSLAANTTPSANLIQAALEVAIRSNVIQDVASFSIEQADHTRLRARCTFFDDRNALQAVCCMQKLDLFGCRFHVTLRPMTAQHPRPVESALFAQDLSMHADPFLLSSQFPRPASTPAPIHPLISHVASPPRGRHAVPDDNVVDLEAIELGLDNRTSVMLKNLPNRMTDVRLFEILNEVTPRAFDFLYVRVDFGTGSSVGYAFVNFLTTKDLLKFGRARLGTRWDPLASEKQVFMSYANIQGKAALVAKFRNSQVMNERMSYRPKIFYSSGPQVGLPEPFPSPDDPPYTAARRLHLSKSAPMLSPSLQDTEPFFTPAARFR